MPRHERGGGDRGRQVQGQDPTDGEWYTKSQFRTYYGGYREWNRACKRSPPGGGGDWGGGGPQAGGRASAGAGDYRGYSGGGEAAHPRGSTGGDGSAQRHYDRERLHWAPPAAGIDAPWRGAAGGMDSQGWPGAAAEGGTAPGGSSGSGACADLGSSGNGARSDWGYGGAMDAPDRGQCASAPMQLPRRGSSPAPRAPQPQPSVGSAGSRPMLRTPERSPPGQVEGSAPPPGSGTPPRSAPAAICAAAGGGGAVAGAPQGEPSMRLSSSSGGSAVRLLLPAGLPQPRGYARDWIAATDHPHFWRWLDHGGRTPPVLIQGRHFCPGIYTPTVQVILWLADEGKDTIGLPDDIVASLTEWCMRCASRLRPFPRETDVSGVSGSGVVPYMFATDPQPTSSPRIGTAPAPSVRGRPAPRGPGRGMEQYSSDGSIDAGSAPVEGPADAGSQEGDVSSIAQQIARAIAPLQQQLDNLQRDVDHLRRNLLGPQAAVGRGHGGAHPGPAPGGGLAAGPGGGQPGAAAGGAAAIPAGTPAQTTPQHCEGSESTLA